jgi:hypothetical protein
MPEELNLPVTGQSLMTVAEVAAHWCVPKMTVYPVPGEVSGLNPPNADNPSKHEVRMPTNNIATNNIAAANIAAANIAAAESSGSAQQSEQRPPSSRLPALEEVKRVNVAVTPAMVAAIQLVMTTGQVSLTEAVRRLIGYGDFFHRAITERGEEVLLRKDGTTRLVVPIPEIDGERVNGHEELESAGRRVPDEYFRVHSSARVWNYWLGGKDNYEVDRRAGEEYIRLFPEIVETAVQARQFLIRAVTYLAGAAGVRQFLDIGAGLPTMLNTHEVAQGIAPEAKVVYVDNDHCKSGCAHTSSLGVWQLGDTARTNPSPGHRRRGPASER